MKLRNILGWLVVPLSITGAPFHNFDFENVRTNSLRPGFNAGELFGPTSELLPGWQLFLGTNLLTSVGYKLDTTFVFLEDGGATLTERSIDGRYSLLLNGPYGSNADIYQLVQTGEIPDYARVLSYTYSGLPFIASINGFDVTPQFQNLGGRTTVHWDISRFAGQTVELSIRGGRDVFGGTAGPRTLDSVAFLVPEPSTNALLVLGALALAGRWYWMSRPRRK